MMKVHEKLTDINQIKAYNAVKEQKLKVGGGPRQGAVAAGLRGACMGWRCASLLALPSGWLAHASPLPRTCTPRCCRPSPPTCSSPGSPPTSSSPRSSASCRGCPGR